MGESKYLNHGEVAEGKTSHIHKKKELEHVNEFKSYVEKEIQVHFGYNLIVIGHIKQSLVNLKPKVVEIKRNTDNVLDTLH